MTQQGQKQYKPAKGIGIALWVYDLGQMAGLGTDTLPLSVHLIRLVAERKAQAQRRYTYHPHQ